MAIRHWLTAVSGAFTDTAKWTGGTVPIGSDDAIIDASNSSAPLAAFTVTSNVNQTVSSISTVGSATLALTAGTFTATNGTGGFVNSGMISIGNTAIFDIGGTFNNAGKIGFRFR